MKTSVRRAQRGAISVLGGSNWAIGLALLALVATGVHHAQLDRWLPYSLGRLVAALCVSILVVAACLTPGWLRAVWCGNRRLLMSLGAYLALHAVALAVADHPIKLLEIAGKELMAVAWWTLILTSPLSARPRIVRTFAWAAAAVVGAQMVALVLGLLDAEQFASAFLVGNHQQLSGTPRFVGWGASPGTLGFTLLACAGLVRGLPDRRARRWWTIAALSLTVLTVSFPSLLVGLVLAWAGIRQRRWRRFVAAGISVAALCPLYWNLLEVRSGETRTQFGAIAPGYHTQGLGPVHQPVRELAFSTFAVRVHGTNYLSLAAGSLRCFYAHPVLGVGAGQFKYRCPTPAMETYGRWMPMQPHNEYLGVLAERGIVGVVALWIVFLAAAGRFRFAPIDRWQSGAVLAYLMCGFTWTVLHKLPFVFLLGLALSPVCEETSRTAPGSRPRARPPRPAGCEAGITTPL